MIRTGLAGLLAMLPLMSAAGQTRAQRQELERYRDTLEAIPAADTASLRNTFRSMSRNANRARSPLLTARAGLAAMRLGALGADPDYSDNSGKGASGIDHIRYVMSLPVDVAKADVAVMATMYYQSIPPSYLQQRFKLAPDGVATQRLYFMASRLATKGKPIEDWKLRLVAATTDATLKPPPRPESGGSRASP